MSNVLTVRVPSPQPATPTESVRGFARGGNDGPAAGSTGFDGVLADYAEPATSPRAKAGPGPADRRPNADEFGATRTADQTAKPGPAMKPTLPVRKREDEDHGPVAARAPATVPSATDPASPIAVDTTAALLSAVVPTPTLPTGSSGPSVAPSAGSTGAGAPVRVGGGIAPGQFGPDQPTASGLGVVAVPSTSPQTSIPSTTPQPTDLSPVVAPASTRPVVGVVPVPPSDISATVSGATVSGATVAPTALLFGAGVGHTSAAVAPADPGAVLPAVPTIGVVTVLSKPVPPTSPPIASEAPALVAGPASAVSAGTGGGYTNAAAVTGDGVVAGGQTGTATTPGTSSPGQPADADSAAGWAQPQGTEVASPARPQNVPTLGVVPVLSTPVPPATTLTPSVASATAQPDRSGFPDPVHQQVYTAVSPLLRGVDGSYGIQLNLRPHELGPVQVNVDVRHGEISIQINATDPAARDALRNGLSDLRQQLEDQGLRAGSMNVASGGANARQPETSWSRSPVIEPPQHGGNPSDQLVATAAAASSSALDLRM